MYILPEAKQGSSALVSHGIIIVSIKYKRMDKTNIMCG